MAANHLDELIMIRSPHLWSFTQANLLYVDVDVRIWVGDEVTDRPFSPTFQDRRITAIDDQCYFDISQLAADYIDVELTENSETEAVWIEVEASGELTTGPTIIPTEKYVGFDGYRYLTEGYGDFEPDVMQSNLVVWVPENTTVKVPVCAVGLDNALNYYDFNPSSPTLPPVFIEPITVDPTPNNTDDMIYYVSNFSPSSPPTDRHKRFVEVFWDAGARSRTIEFRYFSCQKYEPTECRFVNKYGAKQTMYFQGRSVFSYEMEAGDTFNRNLLDTSTLTFDVSAHQKRKPYVNGKQKVTCNTGFISESENTAINQLLHSLQIWLLIPPTQYDFDFDTPPDSRGNTVTLPVNCVTSNLSIKNTIADKLVSYSVEFEAAVPTIMNVR